ncbi:MAPK regulated corepressor interacting protein 2 isoform X2 [Petromyzon marinus]|uniref:MAPK regulated corepressor interacting protein 2 isoform X2 n=1 Tax=Petromyzon marinus TaxID=7757 RepID=UPI003F725C45
MYTITRGPSKMVTHRLRGPAQQSDNKNGVDHQAGSLNSEPRSPPTACCVTPKLVFNPINGKRSNGLHLPTPAPAHKELGTSSHAENVSFVYSKELDLVLFAEQMVRKMRHACAFIEQASFSSLFQTWQNVKQDMNNRQLNGNSTGPVEYVLDTSDDNQKSVFFF